MRDFDRDVADLAAEMLADRADLAEVFRLDELFDAPLPFVSRGHGDETYRYAFETKTAFGSVTYWVTIMRIGSLRDLWSLSFKQRSDRQKLGTLSGRVFSTVGAIIEEFLISRGPERLSWTADDAQTPGLSRFYTSLEGRVSDLASRCGYKLSIKHDTSFQDYTIKAWVLEPIADEA